MYPVRSNFQIPMIVVLRLSERWNWVDMGHQCTLLGLMFIRFFYLGGGFRVISICSLEPFVERQTV